jgi:mRNA interferase RelE/StbE
MKIEFLKQFNRDAKKLPNQKIRDEIFKVIVETENANTRSQIKELKKLSGYKNAYRIKVGDYRIGIFIENEKIQFAHVLHRKDIYKIFP